MSSFVPSGHQQVIQVNWEIFKKKFFKIICHLYLILNENVTSSCKNGIL